jgi:hypothetical protein
MQNLTKLIISVFYFWISRDSSREEIEKGKEMGRWLYILALAVLALLFFSMLARSAEAQEFPYRPTTDSWGWYEEHFRDPGDVRHFGRCTMVRANRYGFAVDMTCSGDGSMSPDDEFWDTQLSRFREAYPDVVITSVIKTQGNAYSPTARFRIFLDPDEGFVEPF